MLSYPFVFKGCFSSFRSFLISPSRWMPLILTPSSAQNPGRSFFVHSIQATEFLYLSQRDTNSVKIPSFQSSQSFPHSIAPELTAPWGSAAASTAFLAVGFSQSLATTKSNSPPRTHQLAVLSSARESRCRLHFVPPPPPKLSSSAPAVLPLLPPVSSVMFLSRGLKCVLELWLVAYCCDSVCDS